MNNPLLKRLLPFLRWLPYAGTTLRADFIAGLTVAGKKGEVTIDKDHKGASVTDDGEKAWDVCETRVRERFRDGNVVLGGFGLGGLADDGFEGRGPTHGKQHGAPGGFAEVLPVNGGIGGQPEGGEDACFINHGERPWRGPGAGTSGRSGSRARRRLSV